MKLKRWAIVLLVAVFSTWRVPLAAQDNKPEPAKPEVSTAAQPKGRRLTEDENVKLQLMQSQFENYARSLCESIGVKFDNCSVGNGVVMERPPAPASQKPEVNKPASKPEKPEKPSENKK